MFSTPRFVASMWAMAMARWMVASVTLSLLISCVPFFCERIDRHQIDRILARLEFFRPHAGVGRKRHAKFLRDHLHRFGRRHHAFPAAALDRDRQVRAKADGL